MGGGGEHFLSITNLVGAQAPCAPVVPTHLPRLLGEGVGHEDRAKIVTEMFFWDFGICGLHIGTVMGWEFGMDSWAETLGLGHWECPLSFQLL